jgi:hypothetical protein
MNQVVALPTLQQVVAATASDHVVAGQPVDLVVAVTTVKLVGKRAPPAGDIGREPGASMLAKLCPMILLHLPDPWLPLILCLAVQDTICPPP